MSSVFFSENVKTGGGGGGHQGGMDVSARGKTILSDEHKNVPCEPGGRVGGADLCCQDAAGLPKG